MSAAKLDSGDPRAYVQLAVAVRNEIASGRLRPGQVVSITTLCRAHGHARQTGSKALQLLVADGLVFRVPGLGYHVTSDAFGRLNHLGPAAWCLCGLPDSGIISVTGNRLVRCRLKLRLATCRMVRRACAVSVAPITASWSAT
jgi:DNA-binding transcriptional MocR family regulator